MVTQANAISAELNRGARLELLVRSGVAHALNDKIKTIMIQVDKVGPLGCGAAHCRCFWLSFPGH